jgi:DNA (cytosine-5)-methyltransferase 1
MSAAAIRIPADLPPAPRRKRIVVGFAGGGGSSIAIGQALGVHPDAALNHWPTALAVHAENFPGAAHYCADILDTDCREVLPGEEIGLAHGEHGERPGSRSRDVRDPTTTLHASGGNLSVVAANLIKLSENSVGSELTEPLHTVMAGAPRHGLVATSIQQMNTRSVGADLRDPTRTSTERAHAGLVAAFMEQANTDMVGHDARDPTSTIVQKGCTQRLVTAQLSHAYTSNNPRKPLKTVMAGGNHAYLLEGVLEADQPMARPFAPHGDELRAFLVKYYGAATAEDLADPLATATSRSRFGLVMVAGVAWRIVDIGMRMLDPETELAAAMGVPASYRLGWVGDTRITKTDVTKMVGNMVSPPPARALLEANCADLPWWKEPERMAA